MKVRNMISSGGNAVANQFIIEDNGQVYFQSYASMIAKIGAYHPDSVGRKVWLDRDSWDYSVTTGRYRNQFLGETKKETQAKIDSGEYELVDLN